MRGLSHRKEEEKPEVNFVEVFQQMRSLLFETGLDKTMQSTMLAILNREFVRKIEELDDSENWEKLLEWLAASTMANNQR